MEDTYSMYVIIGLCAFLLWFFLGRSSQPTPTPDKTHRPRDNVYEESREDRVRRRLKARF